MEIEQTLSPEIKTYKHDALVGSKPIAVKDTTDTESDIGSNTDKEVRSADLAGVITGRNRKREKCDN